jgi:phosphoribosylanthranilate isomerase
MHAIEIKNCGIKDKTALDVAITSGAYYIGFIHYPPSSRHLALSAIETLIHAIEGRAKSVIVTVDPDNELLNKISTIAPDYLQLHGNESAEHVNVTKEMTKLPLIKAIAVHGVADMESAYAYEDIADMLLFDTKVDGQAGGTGQAFDWKLLSEQEFSIPWFLSGGLHEENVLEALHTTGARKLDVSSGLEDAPGQKNIDKIKRFNQTIRDYELSKTK